MDQAGSGANPLFSSCDTIVVLAPHTRAGATMLAKNSDRPPLECQPLFQSPAQRHPEGATVHCQYLEIPQVPETAAVIGSPAAADRKLTMSHASVGTSWRTM